MGYITPKFINNDTRGFARNKTHQGRISTQARRSVFFSVAHLHMGVALL